MKQAIPPAVLQQHIAFLGKTGSGKTSTAKLAVEQIVRDNPAARVCVLDPIKSDWWGLTSSADGKRPGLPFHILGGPRGHVPLHDSAGKAIGELVATGALPLSIIDMADFNAGGLQKFFNDFAPALMKKMRGVVYLVIEEAHEFAPKERSGIGAESMAIHFAKKLATAGRSKGIRLMVLTQRTQALHNALLGSCDTMIAHRLTAPADQEPVKKWLKANVDKEIFEKVSASLSSLKTGSGWICSGEAQVADLVQFPKITTYDNSAAPTGEMDDLQIKTAPVDADKLRAIIGDAVKEAEADDPKKLRAEIARLARELAAKPSAPTVDTTAIKEAAYLSGISAGRSHILGVIDDLARDVDAALKKHTGEAKRLADKAFDETQKSGSPPSRGLVLSPARTHTPTREAGSTTVPRKPTPAASGDGNLSGPLQKIVDAIAWWGVLGHDQPTSAQVGFVSGYKPRGGSWDTYRSRLKSSGLIEYMPGSRLRLTDAGQAAARAPATRPTVAEFHQAVRALLDTPLLKLLEPLLDVYPSSLDAEAWGERARYQPQGGSWDTYKSRLKSLDLITYPERGHGRASDWLFPT